MVAGGRAICIGAQAIYNFDTVFRSKRENTNELFCEPYQPRLGMMKSRLWLHEGWAYIEIEFQHQLLLPIKLYVAGVGEIGGDDY